MFIDANAEVGSVASTQIGDVHPERQCSNGTLFVDLLEMQGLVASNTFSVQQWRNDIPFSY